jgi:hypothetical protein
MVACSSVYPETRMPGYAYYDLLYEIISISGYVRDSEWYDERE